MEIRDEFILAILDDMEKHMANAKTKGEKALVAWNDIVNV